MRTGLLGIVFLFILAITVTEAAQIVGTLLVLSLAITPAAAAQRLSANPFVVTMLSIAMAVIAADGGLLLSFQFPTVKPSVLIVAISFALLRGGPPRRPRHRLPAQRTGGAHPDLAELSHGEHAATTGPRLAPDPAGRGGAQRRAGLGQLPQRAGHPRRAAQPRARRSG